MKFPIDCILCCGKESIPRDMMEEHVTTECPKAEVICPFTLHGCNFKVSICFLLILIENDPSKSLKVLETVSSNLNTLLNDVFCSCTGKEGHT